MGSGWGESLAGSPPRPVNPAVHPTSMLCHAMSLPVFSECFVLFCYITEHMAELGWSFGEGGGEQIQHVPGSYTASWKKIVWQKEV